MGMKKARLSIMICVLIIATTFTLLETKPANAALWVDSGPDQTINEGNIVSFSTSVAPSLHILWYDDYEESTYSGSIRQYLESKGHTVTYFPDKAYLDLSNYMSYDVLVVEHTCGPYTVRQLDQWLKAGKGYVVLLNWAMYADTYDSYIRTLLNVDNNGLPPGEGNSYDWTPSQLYWVNSAHPIATWPNSGWDIKGILCSQYTDHVAIAGGINIVEYAPGKAALVIREDVEGFARIAYLGTNFHGEARTDLETRKLVENMIVWASRYDVSLIDSYRWDFNGDGTYDYTETPSNAPDGTFDGKTTHHYNDNGVFTVTVRVTDKRGSIGTDTLEVTVRNVSPIVEAGVNQTANEGTQVSFSGSFRDPGADSHTIIWDFGDGSTAEGTLTPTHTYVDNGIYTVRLTVTDDDGGAGDDTIIVTVNNVAPTVEAGSDLTIEEGSEIVFAGSFIDPSIVDTHTIAWDFGDGQSVDGTLTPSHTYIENGVYTVTLSVTDKDGGKGIDTLTVTVNNAAPTVEVGQDQTVNEGSSVSFLGSFTDQGSLDTHTFSWDFGDGTTNFETLNPTHRYLDNGIYLVTLTVIDDDGAIGTDTLIITVNNVAPEVEAGADQTVDEATEVSFSGSFIDPGLDTHVIVWDFGDGATVVGTLNPTHTYADNGVYAVTLTVVDDDGDVGKDILTVTVENVAPIVDGGLDIEVFAGEPVTINGIFVDAGWLDTHIATCDFGDGTTEYCAVKEENEYPESTGTVSVSHTYYSVGIYTVTLRVLDDEGAEGSDALKITVKAIMAKIDIDPDTLNLKSEGKWITAYIDLAEGRDEGKINPLTVKVLINSKSFMAEKAVLQDGVLMVKFNRNAISDYLKTQGITNTEIQFTVTGKVLYNDGFVDFEGFDMIRIILNEKGK